MRHSLDIQTLNNNVFRKHLKKEFNLGRNHYHLFSKIIRSLNKKRAEQLVENTNGIQLPKKVGKAIILKEEMKPNEIVMIPSRDENNKFKPVRTYNFHSFGMIGRIRLHERNSFKYPYLYKLEFNQVFVRNKIRDKFFDETEQYYRNEKHELEI